ncbi:MAG: hypothetical protein JO257_05570 [Deltaproteobacteria bacterium]|nr:hypothetical protein [Deltaproteobacteria bacterium]
MTSSVIATAEPLLVAVAGILALVILGLIAMALMVRKRSRPAEEPVVEPVRVAPLPDRPPPPKPRARPAMVRGGGGGGGGLAIATSTSSAMVCPTCRTEYHGMTYCTRDARRLVPPEEMLGGPLRALTSGKSAGLVCMACRRAYEPGLRSCPHDGNELVPFPVYNATRPRSRRNSTEPAGVLARICPVCSTKYDLNARFCGHDAGELVVIN